MKTKKIYFLLPVVIAIAFSSGCATVDDKQSKLAQEQSGQNTAGTLLEGTGASVGRADVQILNTILDQLQTQQSWVSAYGGRISVTPSTVLFDPKNQRWGRNVLIDVNGVQKQVFAVRTANGWVKYNPATNPATPPLTKSIAPTRSIEKKTAVIPTPPPTPTVTRVQNAPVAENEQYYAVQLIASPQQRDTQAFIEQWQDGLNPLLATDKLRKSKRIFIVVYGHYSSPNEAKQVIASLPDKVKKNRPWVIKMRGTTFVR